MNTWKKIINLQHILVVISLLLIFAACSKDDSPIAEENEPSQPANRTVIVYMAADNNLSEAVDKDIKEMAEGADNIPADDSMVLFVHKDSTNAFIAKLTGNEEAPLDTLYKYDSECYDSDPEVFREALEMMMEFCPADEYGLVLWGHATGWMVENDSINTMPSSRAFGYDSNNSTWMNITQMADALAGLPKMKFIFADCCHMGCVEVAYELRNNTEYLIGSSAEIPGSGAPYHLVMKSFFDSSDTFYEGIINNYYDYYLDSNHISIADQYYWTYMTEGRYSVPLAVINTDHIEQLAKATHDVLEQADGGYPAYPLSPDMTGIAYYLGYDFPVMYDMRAFISRIVPASVFSQWDAVYNQAVPYYRMSMKWMTEFRGFIVFGHYYHRHYNLIADFDNFDPTLPYGCISMYIPKQGKGYDEGKYCYNQSAYNFAWNRLMQWNRFGWNHE